VITNPAPAPLATCTVSTDSGDIVVPCEPINEWLAITPEFAMDDDGNTLLTGRFNLTHRPTGLEFGDGSGCAQCVRSAGQWLATLNLDWSALRPDSNAEWLAGLSQEQRFELGDARAINWSCDAEDCEPWGGDDKAATDIPGGAE
jgi:hypothetical protein